MLYIRIEIAYLLPNSPIKILDWITKHTQLYTVYKREQLEVSKKS